MRYTSLLISLLLTLFLFSCATENTQVAKVESTTSNTQTSSQESVKRVVALSSLSADIIYQLDQTKLVGVVGSRLLKDDSRFKGITQVSQGQNPPNLEKIVALKPDLVIGVAGFSDAPLKKIKELGIDTLSTKIYDWKVIQGPFKR